MIGYAVSKNGVKIRLTEERWFHISESHDYMSGLSDVVLDAVSSSDRILRGKADELLAIKRFKKKYVVVVYKESGKGDGFIVTAFLTSKIEKVERGREVIWKRK